MELSEARKIQEVAYDILLEIDRICKENNIEYTLACGTALGAVRHQGFIPWDDDLDISMTRENYERFVQVLPTSLKNDYYYHCFETDKRYNVLLPTMKVRKKNTYIQEANKFLKHGCDGDGLFVDVFVYDQISEHKLVNGLFRGYMMFLGALIFIFENLHISFVPLKSLYVNSAKKYDQAHKNSKKWGVSMTWLFSPLWHQQVYWQDDLFPYHDIKFEDGMFPIAHHEDAFLRVEIGDDYMTLPPVEKQISKHTIEFNVLSDQPKKRD